MQCNTFLEGNKLPVAIDEETAVQKSCEPSGCGWAGARLARIIRVYNTKCMYNTHILSLMKFYTACLYSCVSAPPGAILHHVSSVLTIIKSRKHLSSMQELTGNVPHVIFPNNVHFLGPENKALAVHDFK